MKKTFLKASFFSLMLGALPVVTLTGCKDYDSDIDSLTQRDDTLQKEINDKLAQQSEALGNQLSALETALSDLDAEAARAAAAAKTAADNAQATADQAEANAQAANAKALAAEAAAAQAKADAVKEAIEQVKALQTTVDGQIQALEQKYGQDYTELAAAVAKAATSEDLNKAVGQLQDAISASTLTQADIENMLSEQLSQINENTTKISAISGSIDGINTEINTLKSDLSGNSKAIADETARINTIVNTTIPGIESNITALDTKFTQDIESLNNFKTSAETQLSALNTFQSTYESLLQNLKGIDFADIQTRLSSAETKLTDALTKIADNASEITTINGLITELQNKDTQIDSELTAINNSIQSAQGDITKISGALSTLSSSLSKRLTSVTLVPTLYVQGIPTIEFYSASFKPLGALNAATGIYAPAAANAQEKMITNNDTEIRYRLSPAGVGLSDIGEVTFVQQTAASRAAETPVIKVVSYDKEDDGVLVVTATKDTNVTTGSINEAPGGKIYTVALKVPVAPKNYFSWTDENGNKVTEDAADAVVYSEYCRLAESSFTPEIAQAGTSPVDHFWDATTIWDTNDIVDPVDEMSFVSEGYNLLDLVAGCMKEGTNHTIMSATQLKSFGFTFEFSIPKQAYELDGVNQQEFAKIESDSLLVPTQPANLTSASRVGKTPIVSVAMKYGNDVIDQRFFKIEYTIDAEEKDYEIDVFSKELSCEDIVSNVTWTVFMDSVVNKLPFEMNKDEFLANYTTAGADGVTVSADADAANYITWTVEAWETGNLGGKDKKLQKVLTYTSTTGFPEITVTLNGTIEWPETLPSLGSTSVSYWNDGVMRLLPEAMEEGNPDGKTATYNTNILIGRFAPYLKDLSTCAQWDIRIKEAPTGFTVGGDNDYSVIMGTETAASIWHDADDHDPMSLGDADAKGALKEVFFYIDNNPAGIKLVEDEATVSLGWYIYLNGTQEDGEGNKFYNEYVLNSTNLQIIKPLVSVNTATGLSVTQSATVQTVELAEGMTFTDCYGNTFGEDSPYYGYYDITDVKWLNDMTVIEADGSERTLDELNLKAMVDEATGTLTFTGNGIAQNKAQTLVIPVEVTHKWGVLKSTINVTIQPKL
ncbi:MAG: hypothetical protein K2G27_01245 [Duncaniella sp.]|nr:hypothetical protein [Duncaniella sp.]